MHDGAHMREIASRSCIMLARKNCYLPFSKKKKEKNS